VTGGTGFIGSHACVALAAAGYEPVVLDRAQSAIGTDVLDRMARIIGRPLIAERGDVGDRGLVEGILRRHGIGAVMHLAAMKSIDDSVQGPLQFQRNNVGGLIALLEAMDAVGCRTLLFSGSASVYGPAPAVPTPEDAPRSFSHPYGHTKLIGEDILTALRRSDPRWRIGITRACNPIGAHESGLIGEDPVVLQRHVMPRLIAVASGEYPEFVIHGDDYPTPDGTALREFVHVMDVAEGHLALLRHLEQHADLVVVNLGTGRAYSVLELVHELEVASGRTIPLRFGPRRPGDMAESYLDPSRAHRLMGWRAARSLADMCVSAWRWHTSGHRRGPLPSRA